ncbi:MAG: TlpA disulfide reductase family protein, partial [Longimicrobiales bacterium]|nr:TlpA disulfide reductase family protein [Longimicrobiales bacterium]
MSQSVSLARTGSSEMMPSRSASSPRRLGAVAAAALGVIFLAGAAPASAQSGGVSLALGTQAPDAEVETLDGEAVSLLDFVEPGKPALIEFWATWCEQCEALQPQLDEVQARYGDDVSVVAVAVGVSQSPRRVRRHLEEHDPGYPFLYDARGNAVRAYNAATTSIIVMLDGE